MAKSIAIIGLGRFGFSVAQHLYQLGYDVLGLDTDEKVVQASLGQITYSVQGDATNETTLKELGISNFDAAVVAVASDMQVSLMSSVLLANLEVPLIVARATDALHGNTLERLGVHRVIYPEWEMGESLAHSLFNPDVLEYMDLNAVSGISKIEIPDAMADMSLKDAGLGNTKDKERDGLTVLAIITEKDVTMIPSLETKLEVGDKLVVAGKDEQLEKLHPARDEKDNVEQT